MKRFMPVRIVLIEDNPGDVLLTTEALKESKIHNDLVVRMDGQEGINYLSSCENVPDLVLLDLNLPNMNGKQVLEFIKGDARLKNVPVVVLTASQAEADVAASYDLKANCFVTKPVDFEQFTRVVMSISEFWFTIVRLPEHDN